MNMDFFKTLARRSTDESLMLDIGGNVGGATHTMLEHRGAIHTFEPCPKLAERIRERFKNEPRVTVFQLGVTDRNYVETDLTVYEAWTLGKASEANKRGLSLGALDLVGKEPFTVEFTTVDNHIFGTSYTENPRPVDFIKIDTDGHELRVLKGARDTIAMYRPSILIELGYLVEDVGDSIEEFVRFIHDGLGYQLFAQNGTRLSFEHWRHWYPFNTTFDAAMIPLERKVDPVF